MQLPKLQMLAEANLRKPTKAEFEAAMDKLVMRGMERVSADQLRGQIAQNTGDAIDGAEVIKMAKANLESAGNNRYHLLKDYGQG